VNVNRRSSYSGLPPLGLCAMPSTASGSFSASASASGSFRGLPPMGPMAINMTPMGPCSFAGGPSYSRLSAASVYSLATPLRPHNAAATAAAASEQRQAPPAARQQPGFSSSQPQNPGQHGLPDHSAAAWGTTYDLSEGAQPTSPKAGAVGCFSWLCGSTQPKALGGEAGASTAPKAQKNSHPSTTQVAPARKVKYGRKMNGRWGKAMGRWQQSSNSNSSSSNSSRVGAVSSPTGSQDSLSAANLGHPGFSRQNDTDLSLAEFAAEAAAAAAALRPLDAGYSSWMATDYAHVITSSNTGRPQGTGHRVPYNMHRAPTGLNPHSQTGMHANAQTPLALTTVHSRDKAAAAAAALAAMAAAAAPRLLTPLALVSPMVGLKPMSRVQLMAGALDSTAQRQGSGWSGTASGFSKGHRSVSTPGSNNGGLLLAYRGSMAGSTTGSAQRVSSAMRRHAAVSEAGHGRTSVRFPEGTHRLRAATIAGTRTSSSGSSSLLSEQTSPLSTPHSVFSANSSSNSGSSNCSHSMTDSGASESTGRQVAQLYRSPSKMQAMTGKGQLSWQPPLGPLGNSNRSSNSGYLATP
jgi:hypothetical protein